MYRFGQRMIASLLSLEALGIVARSDEQRGCCLDPDSSDSDQLWSGLVDEFGDVLVEIGDLTGVLQPSPGQGA